MKRKWIVASAIAIPLAIGLVARNLASWRPQLLRKDGEYPSSVVWSRDGSVIRLGFAYGSGPSQYAFYDANSRRPLSQKAGRAAFLNFAPFELRSERNDATLEFKEPADVCATATNQCVPLQSVTWAQVGDVLYSNPCQFSADGKQLWLVGEKQIFRWSSETGKLKAPLRFQIPAGETVQFQALSSDFSRVAARLEQSNKSGIFDVRSGKSQLSLSVALNESQFSPGGRFLVGRDFSDSLQFFDARTRLVLWKHRGTGSGIVFSPDDGLVALDSSKGIEICDVRTGQLKRLLPSKSNTFSPLAFSPDSSHLLAIDAGPITSWRVR